MALLLVFFALLSLLHFHLPLPTFAKHFCSTCWGPEPRLFAWIYTETNETYRCSSGTHPTASPLVSLLCLELRALGVLSRTFPPSPCARAPSRRLFFFFLTVSVIKLYSQFYFLICSTEFSLAFPQNQCVPGPTSSSQVLPSSVRITPGFLFPPKMPKSGNHHRSHSLLLSVFRNQLFRLPSSPFLLHPFRLVPVGL